MRIAAFSSNYSGGLEKGALRKLHKKSHPIMDGIFLNEGTYAMKKTLLEK
jgi:hypothetical protein